MTKRREFIKQSAFLSALLAVNPYELYAKEEALGTTVVKERIVPVSIVWDAANLMTKDKNISWKMIESISEKFNLMACGKVLDKGKDFVSELIDLTKAGNGWDDETHPRVALLAGWLIHREVANVFSPLYPKDVNDMEVWKRDALILKYKIGKYSGQKVSEEKLADILKLMFHRAFFRTHTLTPDKQNWQNWVIDYVDYYHQDRENIDKISNAWNQSSNLTGFFDSKNELIKLANDYSKWDMKIDQEYLSDISTCNYSKALSNATLALKTLDDFYENRISKQHLMNTLKI